MKKILFAICFLLAITTFASAASITKDYLFVVDDQSPASDVVTSVDLIHAVEPRVAGNYQQVLNSEVTREELKNRVTVFIHNKQAVVIVGDTSPAQQVVTAVDIAKTLKEKFNIETGPAKLSSEINYDDLKKSLTTATPPPSTPTPPIPAYKCVETDGGDNPYVKGEAYTDVQNIDGTIDCCKMDYSDIMGDPIAHIGPGGGPCVYEGLYLYESVCDANNLPSHIVYKCPYGCRNGVCLKEPGEEPEEPEEELVCKDSDGGSNYYVKGKVKYNLLHDEKYQYEYWDSCSGDKLNEMYCDSEGRAQTEYYDCPYGCKDGACIESTEEEFSPNRPIDLSNFPNMLVDNKKFFGIFVVGDTSPAEDVISAIDIATGIKNAGPAVEPAKLASEIDDPLDMNIVSIGNPCNSEVSARLMGHPEPCLKGFKEGEGVIRLYNYRDNVQILVAGYSNQDTRKAAKVLANWEDYDLKGREIIVKGSFENPVIVVEEVEEDEEEAIPEVIQCKSTNNLKLGQVEVYEVAGIEYEVALKWLEESTAKFMVNGEITDLLTEGDSYTLSDGTKLTLSKVSEKKAVFCFDGRAGKKVKTEPPEKPKPKLPEIPEEEEEEKEEPAIECTYGCVADHTCLPIGTRLISEDKPSYCDITKQILEQKPSSEQCMNSYECESNVCINNECVGKGLLQKVLSWFMKIFGKD